MYFKDNTYIALLLFIVIILFSFFSEYRSKQNMLYIEGLNNQQEDEDIMEDVNNIEEDTNLVPSCYSSLMDDKNLYNNQNDDMKNNDKYMLKSQMVPPVCPACPTNINNHNHDNSNNNMNDNSNNNINFNGKNYYMNDNSMVDLCNNDLSETQNINVTNEIIDISNSLNENIYNNVNDLQTNYMSQMNNLKNEMVRIQQQFSDNNSMNPNNNYMNSNNNSMNQNNNSMNQNNNSMNSNNCPPCPPCDRCPEPIFSCEKTINYRSPNVGQYLPLPVLNDFSNFTNT